jgi:hypothetical protein
MRRSRIRSPTWSSIAAAVDRPLLGFAMLFTRVRCLDRRIVARSLTRQRDKGRLIPTIQSSGHNRRTRLTRTRFEQAIANLLVARSAAGCCSFLDHRIPVETTPAGADQISTASAISKTWNLRRLTVATDTLPIFTTTAALKPSLVHVGHSMAS